MGFPIPILLRLIYKGAKDGMISASSGEIYVEMPKDKRYLKIAESLFKNLLDSLKLQLDLEEEKETGGE